MVLVFRVNSHFWFKSLCGKSDDDGDDYYYYLSHIIGKAPL